MSYWLEKMKYEWSLRYVRHPCIDVESWYLKDEDERDKLLAKADGWCRGLIVSFVFIFVAMVVTIGCAVLVFGLGVGFWTGSIFSLVSLATYFAALVNHVAHIRGVPIMPPTSEELALWSHEGPYILSETRYKSILYRISNYFHFKDMDRQLLAYETSRHAGKRLDQYEQSIYWFNLWSHVQHGRGIGIDHA